MSYYNSETIAYFFFYGAIFSIYLGIFFNYKVGINVYLSTYIIPLIITPFALIHVVIYRIHVDYSLNLENLIYWELIFYFLLFLSYYIYSVLSKNYFYYLLLSLWNGAFFEVYFNKNEIEAHIYRDNSHEENLKNLAQNFEDSYSIFFQSTILFIYIYIVYFLLKNEDRNLINFFYLIEDITYDHEYIALFFFSLFNSISLSLLIRYKKIKKFKRILDYVNILRLEGQYVIFTKNERMRIDFKLTDSDYEPHFNSKTYYYFLNLNDDGIWYFFHSKVNYNHFNEILSKTSYRPLSKFYSELKERNAESNSN
jgi:hypothetical protein